MANTMTIDAAMHTKSACQYAQTYSFCFDVMN